MDTTPLLRGRSTLSRQALYWHYPHYSDQGGTPAGAITEGDWKLIEFFEDGHLELYNLAIDQGEQYDLSSTFSDKANNLHTKLKNWRQSVDASMPSVNPAFDPRRYGTAAGPLGCSAQPGERCKED